MCVFSAFETSRLHEGNDGLQPQVRFLTWFSLLSWLLGCTAWTGSVGIRRMHRPVSARCIKPHRLAHAGMVPKTPSDKPDLAVS